MQKETVLISLSISELQSIVKESINEVLQTHVFKPTDEVQYLTRKQAADKLHIAVGTLDGYTNEGLLKSYRVGKRVLYKLNEINNHLSEK